MQREWNGNKIGIPAIYKGIPIETYHGDLCVEPSVSSSGLRLLMRESPAHFWAQSIYNPRRAEEKEESAAKIIGRAAHHLLLGEADFSKMFVQRPDEIDGAAWQGNRKVCKQWIADQREAGLTVLKDEDIERIRGMAESLARHPIIKAGILNGSIERSLVWKDTQTGVWMKARPDAMPNDSLDFGDLKTTASIHYDDLMRTIGDYGYHQQAALVGEGCRELLKQKMQSFNLVFIESKAPFCIRVVALKDNVLDLGERMNRAAVKKFADCWKKKSWPGPADEQSDAQPIEIPEWQAKQMETALQYGQE